MVSRPDLIFVVSEIAGFYTKRLFQTTDGRKAESRMGKEEANQDLKWKRKM